MAGKHRRDYVDVSIADLFPEAAENYSEAEYEPIPMAFVVVAVVGVAVLFIDFINFYLTNLY